VTAADQTEDGSFTAAGSVLTIDEALERAIVISDNACGSRPHPPARDPRDPRNARTRRDRAALHSGRRDDDRRWDRDILRRARSRVARITRRELAHAGPPVAAARCGSLSGGAAWRSHRAQDGNLGFATHDAGIVRGPGGTPIVLVVLTWDSGEEEAIDLIREVAVLIYGGLSPVAR
jgi:beta-lactamase class A